jgi:hypothetical protein
MLTCSGHAEPPPSSPVTTTGPMMSQFTAMPVAGLLQCCEYSVIANVEGRPQPLKGEACRQPDGSWHIAEQPVNAGDVYQTVYWPPLGASSSTTTHYGSGTSRSPSRSASRSSSTCNITSISSATLDGV